jgi:hypothetical protein
MLYIFRCRSKINWKTVLAASNKLPNTFVTVKSLASSAELWVDYNLIAIGIGTSKVL